MTSNQIDKLIYYLAKLPGFGQRSARRIVLHLINNKETQMIPLAEALLEVASSITECKNCYNLDTEDICRICTEPKRDHSMICVIETVADLWALERGNIYRGLYHVLGGTLSAYNKKGPHELKIDKLVERANLESTREIIIATNATLEGQTTAFYITERLSNSNVNISRLAHGIPIGGELDYLDEGTISAALASRKPFDEKI